MMQMVGFLPINLQILAESYRIEVNVMELSSQIRLEETKKHGSVLFPFNIYPCTIPADFPSVALHWQKSMEIIFVKKGAIAGDDLYRFAGCAAWFARAARAAVRV